MSNNTKPLTGEMCKCGSWIGIVLSRQKLQWQCGVDFLEYDIWWVLSAVKSVPKIYCHYQKYDVERWVKEYKAHEQA